MSERLFEFVEGTSSKFWAIAVSGATHTVRYGKRGTAGQSKTKTFADDAAARKDADKLVAEKTGKGYAETTAGATVPAAAAKPKPAKVKAEPAKAEEPPAPASVPAPTPAGPVERRVDLAYSDWLFATWRPRESLSPLPPRPKLPADLGQEVTVLIAPDRLAELIDGRAKLPRDFPYWRHDLIGVTQRCVIPYMTDAERDDCRAAARRVLPTLNFGNQPDRLGYFRFHVAALLGMAAELAVAADQVKALAASNAGYAVRFYDGARVLLGLGSAAEVSAAFRQAPLRLTDPHHVRGWLAHTLWHELDYVTESVLAVTTRAECEGLIRALGRCLAPETAPEMLRLALDSKAPGVAREWLHEHPALAAAGLASVARGQSKLAKAAVEFLRELRRKGHAAAVEQEVAAHPDLRATIFADEAERFAELAAADTPEDLREALSVPGKPLGWVDVAGLAPIVVNGKKLGEAAVTSLLNAIKTLKDASLPAAVVAVRRHADKRSLDAFAWELFEAWQREGMPAKEKWAFAAMGHLGGDAAALKLTPLIREWPGQSKHQTAVLGLKVLCGIGTDTALMSLNGIAQKVKFAGVKKAARETMEQIASARGLSRAELEDRIVPDLGLDERGGRDLDFGPRRFRVLLDGQLNPVVRETDGKPRGDLPKPNAKDDPAKAEAAVAGWKLLKKQLKEVTKLQAPRLELAMVTMRRWPVADFLTLIVKHPLMTNFARRLVWAGFDAQGKLVRSFRVTEELDYTDAADKAANLDGVASVGIAHPMQLDAATRNAWGQLLGDYEVVPPFAQLARPVFGLTAAEAAATEVTRFAKAKVEPQVVWYGLQKMGWQHGQPADGGHVNYCSKFFPGAGVTALVCLDPGLSIGWMEGADKQALAGVCFLAGEPGRLWYYPDTRTAGLPLGGVDPIVVSEVLSELSRIAAKGE